MRTLRSEGIDISGVRSLPDELTGLVLRTCSAWREPDVYYYRAQSAFARSAGEVASISFQRGDCFFTTGVTLAVSEVARRAAIGLIREARLAGATVCLDANDRRKLWSEEDYRSVVSSVLPEIDLLFLSRTEAERLTQKQGLRAIGKALADQGAAEIVIKDGADGATYLHGSGPPLHQPAFSLGRIVDPIGAGDAFNAGFLAARAEGCSTEQCLETGTALGAMVCLTPGDWESLPDPEELARFLRRSTDLPMHNHFRTQKREKKPLSSVNQARLTHPPARYEPAIKREFSHGFRP